MIVKSEKELQKLRHIGQIVSSILKKMSESIEIGMKTSELDHIGKRLFEYYDAESAPLKDYNFPGYTCISINEEIAHGIPGERIINAGDLVNIDVSGVKNNIYADTGASFIVPPTNDLKEKLCTATRNALSSAIVQAKANSRLTLIGKQIHTTAIQNGFRVIENLCSHGVGNALHEEPEDITNYFNPKDYRDLKKGMVITIEPFLSTKSTFAKETADGWTLVGHKSNLSAQYEHTMVITDNQPIIVT